MHVLQKFVFTLTKQCILIHTINQVQLIIAESAQPYSSCNFLHHAVYKEGFFIYQHYNIISTIGYSCYYLAI